MKAGKCSECGKEVHGECDVCSSELAKGDAILCNGERTEHYCKLGCYYKAVARA